MPPTETQDLFVSPVEGHVVSRYGSATASRNNQPIGYVRSPGGAFEKIPGVVVRIPRAEAERFSREYEGHLARKELVRRTFADWESYQAQVVAKAPGTPA